jgi:GNAT superfamily N-acetyltransferase
MEGRIDPPSSLAAMTPASLREKAAARDARDRSGRASALVACGYLADTGRSIYLGKLAVHPDHRGQGLLRRIVAEAEAMARARPPRARTLGRGWSLTENHADLRPARVPRGRPHRPSGL